MSANALISPNDEKMESISQLINFVGMFIPRSTIKHKKMFWSAFIVTIAICGLILWYVVNHS